MDIPEAQLVDLARLLLRLYGDGYIGHPRLTGLVEKNNISRLDFLTGENEAIAFKNKQYFKLHQSTLRKVGIITNIAERAFDGTLKTNATWRQIYGSELAFLITLCEEHWMFTVVAIVGSIASILGLILYFRG